MNYNDDRRHQIPIEKFKLIEEYSEETLYILVNPEAEQKMERLLTFKEQLQEKDFVDLEKIIDEIVAIIQKYRYPKPTKYKRRCPDCCYRNLCGRTI